MDGIYYETDVTWNIHFTDSYRYFPCGSIDFSINHIRYDEYTSTFNTVYPAASAVYVLSAAGSNVAESVMTGGIAGDIDGTMEW